MPRFRRPILLLALVMILTSFVANVPVSRAEPAANDPFGGAWERTDKPVADGSVTRTWMWGPEAFTTGLPEDYAESPNGSRTVQYFDKSRMEITNPNGDQTSDWYVTNGLLVMELVTGRMQTGDNAFVERNPAQVNVAGDADDPSGPTYATIAGLRADAARAEGTLITQRVYRAGAGSEDAALAGHGVTAAHHVAETGHSVASPFWSFMQSSGVIWENGATTTAPLFSNPFYATGYPIAEAYWATVEVGGTLRDVLLQCFERRCLTYTPDNPVEWQVEAGNVGQHYYAWRYETAHGSMQQQAAELARRITEAGSIWQVVQATEQALAYGGLATVRGDQTYQDAVGPFATTRATPAETFVMAAEARDKATAGHLTLAQLGQMLSDFEWPFPATGTPGEHLVQMLSVWITGAGQEADDPYNFTAFFLAEMGKRQVPAVDLASGLANPDQVRLTLLEARLFAASIERLDDRSAAGQFMATALDATASDYDPCSAIKKDFGMVGEVAHSGVNLIRRNAVSKALLGAGVDKAKVSQFTQGLQALRLIDRLMRLTLLYSSASASIEVLSDNPIHKPLMPEERFSGFKAHVGVSDAEWDEFLSERGLDTITLETAILDCLDKSGLPAPPTLGTLAGEVTGWKVEWDGVDGMPEHAFIEAIMSDFDMPGQFQHDVTMTDEHSAETKPLFIQIDQETEEEHNTGVEKTTEVIVKASLDTSKPPTLWTFVNATLGPIGTGSSIAELLDGWYREINMPTTYATLNVTYHELPQYEVTMVVNYDVKSTWKHIGYDAASDYFQEAADGSGTVTFKTSIPLSAVDADGPQAALADAIGNGSVHRVSTDYSQWLAYEHWAFDCTGAYQGAWDSHFMYEDIATDTNGERIVVSTQLFQILSEPELWTISGWHGSNGADCSAPVLGDLAVLGSIVKSVPSFSLDQVGEQRLSGDSAAVCNGIRETINHRWGTVPNQPGVQQSCSVSSEWTITVQTVNQTGQ